MRLFSSIGFTLLLFTGANAFAASDYQDQLLEELLLASPGDIIELPEGEFSFDTQLSLTVDQVTIRGQGADKTILSFKEQKEGGEGLLVSANSVTLENFAIHDAPGDGVKVSYAQGVTIRGIHVKWTNGPDIGNGAYGIYPVRTKDVLIESCVVSGASDAGIYVGQSENVIIRRNIAEYNVAGIEVENTTNADVYHNYASHNTGGILVFDLPDLKSFGKNVRVFGNSIVDNNTKNFSSPSNTVADVPRGIGLMVMATSHVEVFENLITNHGTANILLNSYLLTERPINDESYDPYVEAVYVHDNTLSQSGFAPEGGASKTTQGSIDLLKEVIGVPFPDIIWGGFYRPEHADTDGKLASEYQICIIDNNLASFVNLDLQNQFQKLSFDLQNHNCRREPLSKVTLPEVVQ